MANIKNILEKIVNNIQYDDLGIWKRDNLIEYSKKKELFDYQIEAIKNITKVLHLYFEHEDGKSTLKQNYKEQGHDLNEEEVKNINRICLWMATGSGKSLVIIKTIELLDYLQSLKLIPKKDILFLPPREDLIQQFERELDEYNQYRRDKKIDLLPLREYEYQDDSLMPQGYDIKVYYCLSHLLKEEHKENQLDYRSFLNHGNWYVFLDEAHRGKSEESLLKKYVNELSINGFLFNFSATFTDEIDQLTTGYNFNLERFIQAGFGKNIYLSESYFSFKKEKDEFTEREKQLQVLKSLLLFTVIKQRRKNKDYYHDPLMMTLVNTVNENTKGDPDLVMFFKKLEEIANGEIKDQLLNEAKKELTSEFNNSTVSQFNKEEIKIDVSFIKKLSIKHILENLFNTQAPGVFEYMEGEADKEIVLKMKTSDTPFALIRIGDTKQIIKNYLAGKYEVIKNYKKINYFKQLEKSNINLLMGSRAFYEGWDSNRPNVMNFINIGKGRGDDKKFIPQAIGRGIRIEPKKNNRKRLPPGDKEKNKLLETLFIFATDVKSIQDIVSNIENEKETTKSTIIELEKTPQVFDLLIPTYKEEKESDKRIAEFNISKNSLSNFDNYYKSFSKEVLLLNTTFGIKNLETFEQEKKKENFFQIKDGDRTNYQDMNYLLQRIIRHVSLRAPVVDRIKKIEDEIIHFKHIAVSNLNDIEIQQLKENINSVSNYQDTPLSEEEKEAMELLQKKQNISITTSTQTKKFKDLQIEKIAQHYYTPLIYSEQEKIDYIKHIITVVSEVSFLKNFISYLDKNSNQNFEWMFSKIDESLDKKLYIPYFYKTDNWYRNFYPDFIFWIKKGDNYKIVYIDPKGTKYADYLDKLDGFHSIFTENNQPKKFNYEKYNITFDLKLVTDDKNKVSGEKYQNYWMYETQFDFLNIP